MEISYYTPFVLGSFYITAFVAAGILGRRRRVRMVNIGKKREEAKRFHFCKEWIIIIQIYSVAIITCIDLIVDVTVMLKWINVGTTRNIGAISLTILLSQRVISALVFAQEYGYLIGIWQLFDLEIFNLICVSVQFQRPVYGLKKYKILEGLIESFPQLMIQTYFLLKRSDEIDNPWLFHASMLTSLVSLAMCYLISDVYGIKEPTEEDWKSKTNCTIVIRAMFQYGCLGLWRVGEVATRVSVCVAFAAVVSAKEGSFGIALVLVSINLVLIWVWLDTMKATIFYQKIETEENVRKSTSSLVMNVTTSGSFDCQTTSERRFSDGSTEMSMDRSISTSAFLKMDAELMELQDVNALRRISTFKKFKDLCAARLSKILKVVFMITNYAGAGMFASLALPSLCPSLYVKLYFIFKWTFECVLISWCIVETRSITNTGDLLDLFHILRSQIFTDIWYYWMIGAISFFTGGLLSYGFVLDVHKWKKVLEPDDTVLLEMMIVGQYAYVDRAIGNKVCTLRDIIQRTTKKRGNNRLPLKKCSQLLCEMIRHGVVGLGPTYGTHKMGKPNSWDYENNMVSALLHDFDESPSSSRVSKLAKLVFTDLVEEDSVVRVTWEDLRNAGASLTFLRFHVKVSETYFDKNGAFHCTAAELHDAKFDLLFCINRGFSHEELIDAGFKEKHVNLVFNKFKNCKLMDLKQFGPELFEMQFYVKQLRDCKSFSDKEVLDWFEEYRCINSQNPETPPRISNKYGARLSAPYLFKKPFSEKRSMTSYNANRNETLKREAFTIDFKSGMDL